ncbi:MAG: sulfurtransferase TusA family protein [Alphaproteobacteria bacterium]|nr:MAG: sulfurtransferase TusA family protein [Alphaproteobacteria bacterium]
MASRVLDTSGLTCPLPVLRARKALKALAAGETLEVIATDPAALIDFPVFCANAGHTLIETREEGEGRTVFVIRKGG